MSGTQSNSVIDYLRSTDSNVHEEHLNNIRDHYRQVLRLSVDVVLPEDPDEDAITAVAGKLNLRIDTGEARDYLRRCVKHKKICDAITDVSGELAGEEKPIDFSSTDPTQLPSRGTKDVRHITQDPTLVTDITCSLNVKMATTEVDEFIHSFLLQDAKVLRQQITTY
jgi:hypothetical protein